MTSRIRAKLIAGLIFALSCSGVTAGELAKEGSYDTTFCFAGKSHLIAHSETHIAYSYWLAGTMLSKSSGGIWDMNSGYCVGDGSVIKGASTAEAFCEFMDSDKDKTFGKAIRTGTSGTWKVLSGTGKYAGMTGGGTFEVIGPFPTIKEGTFQGCNRNKGTYKLP
jgi:hypothetical protein